MSERLEREEVQKIRDLAEVLVEEYGWSLMDQDARGFLADAGLPETERAQQELTDHAVWLLS